MKNLFKSALFVIALFATTHQASSQELFDKLTKDLCSCLEKIKAKTPDDFAPCFEDILLNNLKEIKKHYKAKTLDGVNMEELGNKVGARIVKECDYVMNTFPSGNVVSKENEIKKQPDLKCDDLKKGDFYYLIPTQNQQVSDTTFVTISNNMFLERMKNGRTYSLLEIDWKDKCKFNLEFKESNDPFKKELSKKGDVYEYEILQNNENSVFIKISWKGRTHQFELFKLK